MPLASRWTGRQELDRIADIRLRCYGETPADIAKFKDKTPHDRFVDGDVFLLDHDGATVATATSLSMSMNVRGTLLPCQGVAWVGTAKSARRRRVDGDGLASTVMRQIIDKARERGQVLSALMPFRGSFYERFGYGFVERQNVWTIPLELIPRGQTGGFRDVSSDDIASLIAMRQRQTTSTHGDIATDETGLKFWLREWSPVGFTMVDHVDGQISSCATIGQLIENNFGIAVAHRPFWDSPAALVRLIQQLGTLRDQYTFGRIILPAALPLNWLLDEHQLPHRRVDHPHATTRTITRMQVRILDHVAVCSALRVPASAGGEVAIAIHESEGSITRLSLQFSGGRVTAKPTTRSTVINMNDSTWAAIAMGDLRASDAHTLGAIESTDAAAVSLLDQFALGPAPFCAEYF